MAVLLAEGMATDLPVFHGAALGASRSRAWSSASSCADAEASIRPGATAGAQVRDARLRRRRQADHVQPVLELQRRRDAMLPAERKSFEQQVMSRRARLLRHAQRLRRRAGALSQPDPARGRDTHRRGRAAGPVRDGAGGGEGAGAFPSPDGCGRPAGCAQAAHQLRPAGSGVLRGLTISPVPCR